MNKISSDVLSGNNSHFNAGIDGSMSTKYGIINLEYDLLFHMNR